MSSKTIKTSPNNFVKRPSNFYNLYPRSSSILLRSNHTENISYKINTNKSYEIAQILRKLKIRHKLRSGVIFRPT